MPDPHIYPEAPNPPLLLPAAAGAPPPTFTRIEQLAAPDPDTPEIAKTMFIRVAVSGPDCPSVISPTAPNFYLRADTGDAVLINDHAQQPNQTYPIFHKPGGSFLDFVAGGSVFLEGDNVFRLEVDFSDAGGEYAWQLGIWNNDAAVARLFTWVVSGTLAKTAQPWIDVAPTALSFDFDAADGQSQQKNLAINNRGTGALVVTDILPAPDKPYSVPAAFPLTVRPNANPPAALAIGFDLPKQPSDIPVTSHTVVAGNDPGPFVAGHNNLFTLSARARQRPPAPQIRYTKEHEYVRVEGAEGVVGVSQHAQEQLGAVVFVEVPKVGTKLNTGDPAAVVESVKVTSDVSAPVSGEVVAANSEVEKTPGLINEDALGRGWLFRLKLSNAAELGPLMDEAAYAEYLKTLG